MPQLWKLVIQNPIRSCRFLHAFLGQVFLIGLHRIVLPWWPRYQSLRLQMQRAYWSSSSFYFPELIHRLPVTDCAPEKARRVGSDWTGYIIPGTNHLQHAELPNRQAFIIYAHGGGYARGEARMYLNYMERWIQGAKKIGLDLTFLSVEYRKWNCSSLCFRSPSDINAALTHDSPHPAQRSAFLKAYKYVLDRGISHENVIFMGDSAGGLFLVVLRNVKVH